jgi:protein SCO1/2
MKYWLTIPLILLVSCEKPRELPIYGQVPDFELTTQAGTRFSARELSGKIWVADFIYTTCTGPCPLMSARMRRVQTAIPEILLLSFSVDPEHDTPEALTAYARRYQAGHNWYFLTGAKETLQMLSRDTFKLSDLGLTHSTRFVLVDQKGRIRGYYGTTDDSTIRTLLSDVRQLQKHPLG